MTFLASDFFAEWRSNPSTLAQNQCASYYFGGSGRSDNLQSDLEIYWSISQFKENPN